MYRSPAKLTSSPPVNHISSMGEVCEYAGHNVEVLYRVEGIACPKVQEQQIIEQEGHLKVTAHTHM